MSGKFKSLAKLLAPLVLLSTLFAGSVSPASADAAPTVRLVGIDASNAFERPGDAGAWVGAGYYHDGLRVFTKMLPVGSTTTLTYAVTGAPTGTTVKLHLNKGWSGSTAKVSVGDVVANGMNYNQDWGWGPIAPFDTAVATGVTDADGNVSFVLQNNDVAADAADYPSSANANYTGTHLYSQITADIGADNEDVKDIIDFVFYKPQSQVDPGTFTGNATVRLAGIDATNSTENTAAETEWSVTNNWYRGGVRALTKQVPVGSTQHLTFVVNNSADGTPLANTSVTFVFGKAYSGSSAKVNVGSTSSTGGEARVTGVTGSDGTVSFDLVNTDVAADAANNPGSALNTAPSGKDLRTQIAAWVTSQAQDTIDVVDLVYYKPADVAPTPTVVSRINGIDETNAAVGSTDGWAQYYAAGLRYFERGVTVGTTTHLSYTVTADGAPYANKTVHLLLGKTYSGSTANVTVNGVNFTGAQQTIDLTTDANGVVSFDVSNSNVTAQADAYQANNVLHPANGKHLFVQLALVGEKGNQDVLDMLDLVYYAAQSAPAPTTYNVRLADWNAGNSFDGTHVWGDGGIAQGWFDTNTRYFAHYVKVGSTFTLRYRVTNAATGAAAPNGTVVDLALGTAWSNSNAKFTVNGVSTDGLSKWNCCGGQLDQASTTATVSNGYISVTVVSLDDAMDATANPGSSRANPDQLNPLFMQIKTSVEGNSITHQDWVNIIATQAKSAAPTITSVSATSGKNGQAIDIVGTNLNDATGASVVLYTAATRTAAAVTQNVTVLSVNADGTRMTIASPATAQKGTFKVTTSGGTATAATSFSSSATTTAKATITFPASLVKEVGSTFTLSGTNIASASSIAIGSVSASFTILTANSVVVTVPDGVVSGSTIRVTNAGGTTTSSKVIYQAAVVSTATASAKVGQTVTITGSNLVATSVVFGGNKTAKPVINNGSTLTVVVPAGATTGAIKIVTGAGAVYTASFTVVPPTPTVTSFTPSSGKSGTVVSVKGTNLLGATVTIGSTSVTVSAGATATLLKFVIPAGATTGKINVTTAGGTASSATNLTITN